MLAEFIVRAARASKGLNDDCGWLGWLDDDAAAIEAGRPWLHGEQAPGGRGDAEGREANHPAAVPRASTTTWRPSLATTAASSRGGGTLRPSRNGAYRPARLGPPRPAPVPRHREQRDRDHLTWHGAAGHLPGCDGVTAGRRDSRRSKISVVRARGVPRSGSGTGREKRRPPPSGQPIPIPSGSRKLAFLASGPWRRARSDGSPRRSQRPVPGPAGRGPHA
jgi:hypothetical protein